MLPVSRFIRSVSSLPSSSAVASMMVRVARRTASSSSSSSSSGPTASAAAAGNEAEARIEAILREALTPSRLSVKDVSGGCGSMYALHVESPLFQGKSTVAQHKMVTGALREEIKAMHGLTLTTKASPPPPTTTSA